MNALRELSKQGQSIWLDYIEGGFIQSGELKRLVQEDGVRGLTSNPTIFEKAIAGSADYDDALRTILANDPQVRGRRIPPTQMSSTWKTLSDPKRSIRCLRLH